MTTLDNKDKTDRVLRNSEKAKLAAQERVEQHAHATVQRDIDQVVRARVEAERRDVGHVRDGLFVEGRIAHIIDIAGTQVTPVPIEQSVEEIFPGVTAAAVGVKTDGQDALVVVLCDGSTTGVADLAVQNAVRGVAPQVASVLYKKSLPVDRRHNSKIDRTALSAWATTQLSK